MFRAFDVRINNTATFAAYTQAGRALFAPLRTTVRGALRSALLSDGKLDGATLRRSWFPGVECDVFISHSHQDLDLAFGIAGWLDQHFGLRCFVDSGVWGYAEELLLEIDDSYCQNPHGLSYSYQLRNQSTAHVHAMLSTALVSMMDRSEAVFFLNTPAASPVQGSIQQTSSPWIFHEIETANRIRVRRLEDLRKGHTKVAKRADATEGVAILHTLDLDRFTKTDDLGLTLWKYAVLMASTRGPTTLDHLYQQYPIS